jgi:uncharacterized Zn finger protein
VSAAPNNEEGGRVIQMLPPWPKVRCNSCGEVYRINKEQTVIVGHCPTCGHERFSTTLVTEQAE